MVVNEVFDGTLIIWERPISIQWGEEYCQTISNIRLLSAFLKAEN